MSGSRPLDHVPTLGCFIARSSCASIRSCQGELGQGWEVDPQRWETPPKTEAGKWDTSWKCWVPTMIFHDFPSIVKDWRLLGGIILPEQVTGDPGKSLLRAMFDFWFRSPCLRQGDSFGCPLGLGLRGAKNMRCWANRVVAI